MSLQATGKQFTIIILAFLLGGALTTWWFQSALQQAETDRDKINHTPGLKESYIQFVSNKTDVFKSLKAKGVPDSCFVISYAEEIDLQELSLQDTINRTESCGWGTIISCIPGKLIYYYGEMGEQRSILEKRS